VPAITDIGRFAGKTVIVTGAASGIGRATAARIAAEIVNVASEAVLRPSAAGAAYAASKHALAAAIVWLLSDEAANVNGIVLPSDGGWPTA
jgi:NAD(P)-dependent dehydrogenase (short-subunit alcohol dehydrogenase family)